MTAYCLEYGTREIIIHRLDCGGFDLASLMGEGRICGLGNYPNAELALAAARLDHSAAVLCMDCGAADLGAGPAPAKTGKVRIFSLMM